MMTRYRPLSLMLRSLLVVVLMLPAAHCLVGVYGDFNAPGDLYKVSADFSKKERITELEPRLEGVTFGPVETFTTEVRWRKGSYIGNSPAAGCHAWR